MREPDHNLKFSGHMPAAGTVLIVSIVINALYVAAEAGMGFWTGSLGLLSDAGHNLGDVLSLALALAAVVLASTRPSKRYTYGYRKVSVVISLLNAVILLIMVGAIVVEAAGKFRNPAGVALNGTAISLTAGAGILVNGFTAFLLGKSRSGDINMRAAFLHMLADTAVSVGVVISGLVIRFTGWTLADPIVSLAVAVVIFVTSWRLLAESFRMSIDAVPDNIDIDGIYDTLCSADGVKGVHHVHVWAISTTEVALTAHIVVNDLADSGNLKRLLKERIGAMGVGHSTLEFETVDSVCNESECQTL